MPVRRGEFAGVEQPENAGQCVEQLGATPDDIMSILQALHEAGAWMLTWR